VVLLFLKRSIDDVKNGLSGYLQLAKKESLSITRTGQPVGLLIGLENSEDWWEEIMMHDLRFETEIAQARQSLRAGKGISIEVLRTQSFNEQSVNF